MPSSSCMIDTPVSVSPRMTAHCTGAAPRYFGNTDAWTLMQPRGTAPSTAGGRILPYATTTASAAPDSASATASSPLRADFGWITRRPSASSARFTAGACSCPPRPAGLSGCDTTSTISCAAAHARKHGTANSGEPMNASFTTATSFDQVRQVRLAQPIVAQHAERLVEDVGDVVELLRELAPQVDREAIRGEVATRRLVRAADLERGGVAADAEQREVVRLGHQLPARAHAFAVDREVGLADERGRLVGDLGVGAARGREAEHAQPPREWQHVGDIDVRDARDRREIGLAVERRERRALLGAELAGVDDAAEAIAV